MRISRGANTVGSQIAKVLNETLFTPTVQSDPNAIFYNQQGIIGSLLADSGLLASNSVNDLNPLFNSSAILSAQENSSLLNPVDDQSTSNSLFNTSLINMNAQLNNNTNGVLALLAAAYGLSQPSSITPLRSVSKSIDTEA